MTPTKNSGLLTLFIFSLSIYICSTNPTFLQKASKTFLDNSERILLNDQKDVNQDHNPTINDYISLLKHANFFGTWNSLTNLGSFSNFENNQGIFILEFSQSSKSQDTERTFIPDSNEYLQSNAVRKPGSFSFLDDHSNEGGSDKKKESNPPVKLTFKIYDGEYLDHQSLRIYYYMNSTNLALNTKTATISDYHRVKKFKTWHEQDTERQECNLHLSLGFLDKNTHMPYKGSFDSASNLAIKLVLESEDCDIKLEAPLIKIGGFVDEAGARIYMLVSCLMTAINIVGVLTLKKRFKRKVEVYNLSLASVWLTIAIDYYILIVNLVLIFSYSTMIVFSFVLNILLTFILEKSLMTRILEVKSRRSSTQLLEEDCRSCSWHFAIAALFFIFQLVFVLMYELWILYLTALILVPQISENYKKNRPYRFNFPYIGLVVAPKLIIIAYIKLYPLNIFRISPEPGFVLTYASLIFAQILILAIQTKFPRIGFDFGKSRHSSKMLCDDDLCPICMGHLSCSNMDISPTLPRKPTIETSCTHSFHVPCLKQWAQKKIECPLCRNNIEDIMEELDLSDEE